MIENITIEAINIKSGTSKTGRGYAMPIIDTTDGRKISMYIDKEYDIKTKNLSKVERWKAGDVVSVDIEQNGEYLNFKLPSKVDILGERVDIVESDISILKEQVLETEVRIEKVEGVIKNAQNKTK